MSRAPLPPRRCAHCKQECTIHGRGLCSPCYHKREVREQYTGKPCFRGEAIAVPTEMDAPVKFPLGSEQMVEVYRRRVASGKVIWNPEDGVGDDQD